ncbi:hypothetical protein DOX53_18455 [Cronobacter malonaticus]|nr:hypothetical protein [Cronobacter malonaticus]EGT4489683.1 hypothetical protein [Cronobacter malonaticus]
MGTEGLIGGIITLVFLLVGAWRIGKSQGKYTAETDTRAREAEQRAAGSAAAAERRVEATKRAADAEQAVNHMSGDDVDRELLDHWQRKS